ncbi:MAG: YcxB family protein [Sphingomonadaceae bacterium]|nr:YcxB family protein [Sphingomonadaceae bacterium]
MDREVNFTPNEADYVAANRAWLLRYLTAPNMRWIGAALGASLLIGIVTWINDGEWRLLAYVAVGSAVFAAIQLSHWLLVPRRVRRMLQQRPSLLTPNRFVWDEEGLEAESDAGLTRVRWRELHRWFAGAHGFVFLLSDYMLLVLPARALTREQTEDLRGVLLAHPRSPRDGAT